MSVENTISVQVQKNDMEFINSIDSEKSVNCTILETSSFDGQSEIVTILLTVTPLVLTFLGKIISEQIKAKKHVKIIYKGVQIQGIDEKNVTKILNEIVNIQESKK